MVTATFYFHIGLVAIFALFGLCDSFSSLILPSASGRHVGDSVIGNRCYQHQHQHRHRHRVAYGRHVYHRWPRRFSLSSLHMSAKSNTDASDAFDKVNTAIDVFISTLQTSLLDGSFESFTLTGPVAPRKGRKSNNTDADAESLRGKFKRISGRLILLQDKKQKRSAVTKKNGSTDDANVDPGRLCVQTTIKYFLATDIVKNWEVGKRLDSDQTEVEEGLRQIFLTAMGDGTDGPLSEWGAQNSSDDLGIRDGSLDTSGGVYKLRLHPSQTASFQLSKKKPPSDELNRLPQLTHDRVKNVELPPSSKFFQKLGVSNADGKPLAGMSSKLRQCQKFVEIVGSLVDNGITPSRIRVIDMGCGRGYLTFSLHSYLSNKFGLMQDNNMIGVETQGIDRRPKLINEVNGIARDLGGEFATLNFVEGSIECAPNNLFENDRITDSESTLDILIALHACDTATDDALWFAIARNVDIIVTAPCCQHELRPQIDKHAAANPDQPLSNILRHAIYRERATETVTDAMRAILLEIAGYETNVFEFVGGEHTAKNVMITATKIKFRKTKGWLQVRRQRLIDLAELYGIKYQRLAMLMEESISMGEEEVLKSVTKRHRSGMAPL
ncbi:hypothetical protein ACHAWU_009593 [Discostella pseudostelligera]|uniref:Methyltransferase domain-containing protein n=1 Tax=Discostella pseudostelligera TaxID=259834 RepID=A0ABD3MA98_9STRA